VDARHNGGMTSQVGSDLFVFPGAAVQPFLASCTSAIRSMVLPEGPGFRKSSGSLPLTIVRPCFGQNCIECLASSAQWKCDRPLSGTLDPGQGPPSLRCPPQKACDGKGEVW
jgi:hypothetical protein